jgi:conjugal transfer pilus assembly protein TraB
MNPKHKRWLAIGSTVVVVGTIMGVAMNAGNPEREARTRTRPTVEAVITDQDPRAQGLDAMASQLRQLQTSQARMERNIQQLRGIDPAKGGDPKVEALELQLQQIHESMADMQDQLSNVKPGDMPVVNANGERSATELDASMQAGLIPQRSQFIPSAPTSEPETLTEVFSTLPEPPPVDPTSRTTERSSTPKIRTIRNEKSSTAEDAIEKVTITIPGGSILSGVLVTGMDAATGNQAQRDPFPTLLRIKHEALLPNRFRADFRECFLLASGWGDLSSERAYMRADRISCIRNDGTALESSIEAFATGEDGKVGVRGRLVSKQGQVIARSLVAGFAQGVSNAFDVRKVPSININRGNETVSPVYEQAMNSSTAQAAAAQGVGTAMERIADYYLAMAENIFPVIEIDAMREIDFIVNRGMKVTLSSADALTQVSLD